MSLSTNFGNQPQDIAKKGSTLRETPRQLNSPLVRSGKLTGGANILQPRQSTSAMDAAAGMESHGLKRIVPEQRDTQEARRDNARRRRFIELVIRGAWRHDFSDPYHIAIELSWKEFALAFAGFNVVFALLYLASPGCVANMRPGSFSKAFFFSLETLATVGYGAMAPATLYGHAVSAIESSAASLFLPRS